MSVPSTYSQLIAPPVGTPVKAGAYQAGGGGLEQSSPARLG